MGDRYEIIVECVYCNSKNEVWYAPTCECMTFECVYCKKDNFVTENFKAKKIGDVTLDDVKNSFLMATSGTLSENDINSICEDIYKRIEKSELLKTPHYKLHPKSKFSKSLKKEIDDLEIEKDVTEECEVKIERYDSGYCGIVLYHKGNRLLSIKDKQPTKLWDMNKGYELCRDKNGNFQIFFDKTKNKICSKCGHKIG